MEPVSQNVLNAATTLVALNRQFPESDNGGGQNPAPQPDANAPQPSLTITVTPGENNAGPGEDRSDNSAVVNISTPERQAEFSVTREQAVDVVYRRSTQNAINQTLGGPQLSSGVSPFTAAAIAQAGSPEEAQAAAVQAAQLQATRNTAQFAANQFNANPVPGSTGGSSSGTDFYSQANTALATKQKQAVFAAVLDNANSAGNNIDETI